MNRIATFGELIGQDDEVIVPAAEPAGWSAELIATCASGIATRARVTVPVAAFNRAGGQK